MTLLYINSVELWNQPLIRLTSMAIAIAVIQTSTSLYACVIIACTGSLLLLLLLLLSSCVGIIKVEGLAERC